MKSVQVSVIVPSYNAELYIGRCIRSLLKQSLSQEDFEIIVINDSSKDNTKNALLPFVGDIVLIENKRNLGLPSSLNKGIKKARGQFIVRVDSDDYVHVDFLKILSLHLQLNHSIDAIATDYLLVNNDQDIIKQMNKLSSTAIKSEISANIRLKKSKSSEHSPTLYFCFGHINDMLEGKIPSASNDSDGRAEDIDQDAMRWG